MKWIDSDVVKVARWWGRGRRFWFTGFSLPWPLQRFAVGVVRLKISKPACPACLGLTGADSICQVHGKPAATGKEGKP